MQTLLINFTLDSYLDPFFGISSFHANVVAHRYTLDIREEFNYGGAVAEMLSVV